MQTRSVPITGITPDVTRQLTLNEVMAAGGPLEILLNNTKWDGTYFDGTSVIPRPDFLPVNVNGVASFSNWSFPRRARRRSGRSST